MPDNVFLAFVGPLTTAGFRYAVTGSVAGIAYGEPRMTNDIDIRDGPDAALGARRCACGRCRRRAHRPSTSSQKHLHDIAAILRARAATLDMTTIALHVKRLGLADHWSASPSRFT